MLEVAVVEDDEGHILDGDSRMILDDLIVSRFGFMDYRDEQYSFRCRPITHGEGSEPGIKIRAASTFKAADRSEAILDFEYFPEAGRVKVSIRTQIGDVLDFIAGFENPRDEFLI